MTASIVGWAHTPFGKFDAETVESLVVKVATEALADAGISAEDVDEIVLGHFNAGFSPQDFTASLVLQADPKLRFKPATRVENACATGSAAVHQGIRAIASGNAKIVLVVGVEQMTRTPAAEIGRNLLRASYLPEDGDTPGGFAGVFGKIAQSYFQKYGDQSDALAMIAAKNHKNGVANPYAQMRKDFGYEFCRAESEKNPFVAGPLKRTDCSLVSDGAAALVLTDSDTAKSMGKAVNIRATAHAQDFLPMSKRDILQFEGCTVAWQRALQSAGVQLSDLSFVETHDCFTVAELIEYEAMGLTPKGQGAAGAGRRRREDDRNLRRAGRRHPARRLLPQGGGRDRRRFRRDLRKNRAELFPALWRSVRRTGADRRQKPQKRRRQSAGPNAKRSRL